MSLEEVDRKIGLFLKKKPPKESVLQKKIIEWLQENIKEHKEIRKVSGNIFSKNGFPDIEVFLRGTTFSFEIKRSTKEKPTPLQIERIRSIRKTGNHAWVVRSLEEVKDIICKHTSDSPAVCRKYCDRYCDGLDFTGKIT